MSGRRQRKKHANWRPGQRRNRKQVQRNVKDRLFWYLFEKDREALLDLYNALNGTSYQEPSQFDILYEKISRDSYNIELLLVEARQNSLAFRNGNNIVFLNLLEIILD